MSKRFKSPTGQNIRIVLMSGHATIVGSEWRELDERYHSAAYSLGCVSEDMYKNKVADKIPMHVAKQIDEAESLEQRVYEAIDKMVKENDLESFTKSGVPDAFKLTNDLGERVSVGVRDKVWYKYQKDNATEEA